MKQETDFLRLGIMLELYALTALENNDFTAKGPAMKELQGMLSEHIVFDYYYDQFDGDAAYIRSGNKALLTYVYCSLKEWFPNPDIGNVLHIGEKMHLGFAENHDGDDQLDEQKIRDILRTLDGRLDFSRIVFGESIPVFLLMDVSPVTWDKNSLRSGCEQIHNGFVIWRLNGRVLPVPSETALLLNLADHLVQKAWFRHEKEARLAVAPLLEDIHYEWVLKEDSFRLKKLLGDLVCIGLAWDTPLFQFMPFSDQSRSFRSSCAEIAAELLETIDDGSAAYSLPFH